MEAIEWEQCGNLIRTKRNEDGSGGWLVAEVSLGLPDHAKTARLLTAAPELLEALRTLLDAVEGNHVTMGDCNQARAAIASATGEAA